MLWTVEKRSDRFVVVREDGLKIVGTHLHKDGANAQLTALYVNVLEMFEKTMSRSEAGKFAAEQRWKGHVATEEYDAIEESDDRWEPAEYDGSIVGLIPNRNITPETFDIETLKSKKIEGLTIHKIRMDAGGKVMEVIGVYVSPKNGKTYGISSDSASGDAHAYAKGNKAKVAGLQVSVNRRDVGVHEIFEALVINSHLRVGLMTAMLETVRATIGGVIHHSDILSEQGAAWAAATPFDKAKFGSRSEAGKYAAHIRWMRERGQEPLTPEAWSSQNAQPVVPPSDPYTVSLDAIKSFASEAFQIRLNNAGRDINVRLNNGRIISATEYLNVTEMGQVGVSDPNDPNNTLFIASPPLMAVEREVNALGALVHDAILEKMKQGGFILPNGEFDYTKQDALKAIHAETHKVMQGITEKHKELGLYMYSMNDGTQEVKLGWREDPTEIDSSKMPPHIKELHQKWEKSYQELQAIPWSERLRQLVLRQQITDAKDKFNEAAVAEFDTWFNANHNPSGSGSHKDQLTKMVKINENNARAVAFYPSYVERYAETFSKVMGDLNISAKSQIGTSDQVDLSRSRLTKAEKTKFATDIHTFFPDQAIKIFGDRYGGLKVTKASRGGGHWNVADVKILTDMSEGTNIHEFMHALTYADKRAYFVERAFLMRRRTAGGRDNEPIKKRIVNGWEKTKLSYDGGRGKRSDSKYIRDQFTDEYTGRHYDDGHTETMTTGLDRLAEGGSHIGDQDHTNTVLGLLIAIGLGQ